MRRSVYFAATSTAMLLALATAAHCVGGSDGNSGNGVDAALGDAPQSNASSDASTAQEGASFDGRASAEGASSDSNAAIDSSHAEAAPSPPPPKLTASGPVTIKGQDGGVLSGLKITSTTGDCVTIDSTYGFTLRASEIGPCSGNAIVVTGGGQITIEDSYIHPEHPPTKCCDTGDGIFATGTTALSILGNVIAYGEANIEVQQTTGVTVTGNFLLNPQNGGSRGQNFQAWSGCSQVDVEHNYALSSFDPKYTLPAKQEDSLNFGITNGVIAKDNYVTGGLSRRVAESSPTTRPTACSSSTTFCSTRVSAVSRSRTGPTRPSAATSSSIAIRSTAAETRRCTCGISTAALAGRCRSRTTW